MSEQFSIAGVSLFTPAWKITNLDEQLLKAPALRGTNTVVPHADGTLPNRRRVTETVAQVHMEITGWVTQAGSANSDPHQGIITNCEYLRDHLGFGTAVTGGTVTAIWTRPNASTVTFGIIPSRFDLAGWGGVNMEAVLEFNIPAGRLPAAV